jgi:hypothetical protein
MRIPALVPLEQTCSRKLESGESLPVPLMSRVYSGPFVPPGGSTFEAGLVAEYARSSR